MGVIAALQDQIAQTNVRTTILDRIALKDAMKRAETVIKQRVYVIMGVILDGVGSTVNRNAWLAFMEMRAAIVAGIV